MHVRVLTESDTAAFHTIRLKALADNPEAFASTFAEEETNAGTKFQDRLKQNPNNIVLGVFDERNEIRGMLGVVRHSKEKVQHIAEIWGTYVEPTYRGKGAAKALMEHAIDAVKKMGGVEQLKIAVVTENAPARQLYVRHGFEPYGIEKNAFRSSSQHWDLEHMLKILCITLLLLIGASASAESFESNCGGTKCAVYGIDISTTTVEMIGRENDGQLLRNAKDLKRWASKDRKSVQFAMNGGIFDRTFRPLGLFIQNGKKIVPLNTSDGDGNFFLKPNGVFFLIDRSAHIVETSQYVQPAGVRIATQSGPLLLQSGVINSIFKPESKNRKVRNGVGVLNERKVYFVISNDDVSFFDFAAFFRDTLKCTDALYLDGVISRAFIPGIGRMQDDGDFAAQFAVFEPIN